MTLFKPSQLSWWRNTPINFKALKVLEGCKDPQVRKDLKEIKVHRALKALKEIKDLKVFKGQEEKEG